MERINPILTKYDVYAATVPQIQEISEKIIALAKLYHGIKIDTCKLDIDAAFMRDYLLPDVLVVACNAFKAITAKPMMAFWRDFCAYHSHSAGAHDCSKSLRTH